MKMRRQKTLTEQFQVLKSSTIKLFDTINASLMHSLLDALNWILAAAIKFVRNLKINAGDIAILVGICIAIFALILYGIAFGFPIIKH